MRITPCGASGRGGEWREGEKEGVPWKVEIPHIGGVVSKTFIQPVLACKCVASHIVSYPLRMKLQAEFSLQSVDLGSGRNIPAKSRFILSAGGPAT